jgi:hypothetical protein
MERRSADKAADARDSTCFFPSSDSISGGSVELKVFFEVASSCEQHNLSLERTSKPCHR